MDIFLTGATGYVGAAIAKTMVRAGHTVWGLTRSGSRAERLRRDGVNVVLGDLREPWTYRAVAERCDAVVHAAVENGPGRAETDRKAVAALTGCLSARGGPRQLVYTSGVWVLGPRRAGTADEAAPCAPPEVVLWRPAMEEAVLAAARPGVSAVVVRPGCVYGGQGGLYGLMFRELFEERRITLVGDGANAWAAVYLDDLAELYRLVVEKQAPTGIYHAVDGSADPVRVVAESFAEAAGGADVLPRGLGEVRDEIGPWADALAMDQHVTGEKARRELGWSPMLGSPALNAEILLAQWHDQRAGLCLI